MALPLDVPMEYRHPGWNKDALEVIEPTGLTLGGITPANINSWVVKLSFNDSAGNPSNGSGFLTNFPGAPYDVILTAGHNLIHQGKETTGMEVAIGTQGTVSVTSNQYRIAAGFRKDESNKACDYGAILLDRGTFAKPPYNAGYGFGFSLRLAEEDYLKGTMYVSGYRAPTPPGAPNQTSGDFVECTPTQLKYTASTEAGISGSVVWMPYNGEPFAVAIHNYGPESNATGNKTKRAKRPSDPNMGSRITLSVLREVLAWVKLDTFNRQLRAAPLKAKKTWKEPLPASGLFLNYPEGWDFARVRLGSGSRFDLILAQSNPCVKEINMKAQYVMLLKDQWIDTADVGHWVYFDQAKNELSLTKSLKKSCFFEKIAPKKKTDNVQLVVNVPDQTPQTWQLRIQKDYIDENDPESESSEVELVQYPATSAEEQYTEFQFTL